MMVAQLKAQTALQSVQDRVSQPGLLTFQGLLSGSRMVAITRYLVVTGDSLHVLTEAHHSSLSIPKALLAIVLHPLYR